MNGSVPLRAMLIAACATLLACLLLIASYWQYFSSTEQAYLEYDRARLASLHVGPEASGVRPLRVVGIGRSNTLAATFHDEDMEAFAGRLGVPLRFVRLARGRGGPRDWRDLMADVREARPDVVVVEAQYLFLQPNLLYYHWKALRDYPETICREGRKAVWGRRPKDVLEVLRRRRTAPRRWRRNDVDQVRRIEARGGGLRITVFGLRNGWEEVLRDFQNDGISVILVRLPTREVEAVQTKNDVAPAIDEGLREIESAGLADVLRCPIKFRYADFGDGRHMSSSGREKFSTWLVRELADMVSQ